MRFSVLSLVALMAATFASCDCDLAFGAPPKGVRPPQVILPPAPAPKVVKSGTDDPFGDTNHKGVKACDCEDEDDCSCGADCSCPNCKAHGKKAARAYSWAPLDTDPDQVYLFDGDKCLGCWRVSQQRYYGKTGDGYDAQPSWPPADAPKAPERQPPALPAYRPTRFAMPASGGGGVLMGGGFRCSGGG